MLVRQSVIGPNIRIHLFSISSHAMVSNKNKDGIMKITFLLCCLHILFKTIIRVTEGVEFFHRFKSVAL
jgi:hypothetical protein